MNGIMQSLARGFLVSVPPLSWTMVMAPYLPPCSHLYFPTVDFRAAIRGIIHFCHFFFCSLFPCWHYHSYKLEKMKSSTNYLCLHQSAFDLSPSSISASLVVLGLFPSTPSPTAAVLVHFTLIYPWSSYSSLITCHLAFLSIP